MRRKSMKKMMRKKAKKTVRKMKRVSTIQKGKRGKNSVFRGRKVRTSGGLKKSDLKMNKRGKVVSAKQSKASRKQWEKNGLKQWAEAVGKQRKKLHLVGFVPIGGRSNEGKKLLKTVKSLLK